MEIAGFQKESFIDYPGKISSVVFTPGCNYHCPGCHAKELLKTDYRIKEESIFDYLSSKKGWIDAVVLCGGNPILQKGLEGFLYKVGKLDLEKKLDTNGSKPGVLKNLIKKGLLDYVALDVKAPPRLYGKVIGIKNDINNIIKDVERSMKILSSSGIDYEFRTTIMPFEKDGKINYLNKKDVTEITRWIVETTGKNDHDYFLQKFVPRKDQLIDSRLEGIPETPNELMIDLGLAVSQILPKVEIR